MRNRDLKHAIDKARRAQLDEQGGYTAVERDARILERQIDREADQATVRIAELELRIEAIIEEADELRRKMKRADSHNADLSRQLKLARNRLYSTRKARDYWYSHAGMGTYVHPCKPASSAPDFREFPMPAGRTTFATMSA